jgi:hypothetical protein
VPDCEADEPVCWSWGFVSEELLGWKGMWMIALPPIARRKIWCHAGSTIFICANLKVSALYAGSDSQPPSGRVRWLAG